MGTDELLQGPQRSVRSNATCHALLTDGRQDHESISEVYSITVLSLGLI